MRRLEIPGPVLAVVSEFIANVETHATLETLFTLADAPSSPPSGSKKAKALAWLKDVNKAPECDPLRVLGRLVETYMDRQSEAPNVSLEDLVCFRERLQTELAEYGLAYFHGGKISPVSGTATKALSDYIRDRDFRAIEEEFERAIKNVEKSPREAVSAASNILESFCKVYLESENVPLPTKLDLQGVWSETRKRLRLDPSILEEQDLKQVVSGLISIVHGIGSLRTHSSSAHGAGLRGYKLEPRHARLAIHAAHSLTLFLLESWEKGDKS